MKRFLVITVLVGLMSCSNQIDETKIDEAIRASLNINESTFFKQLIRVNRVIYPTEFKNLSEIDSVNVRLNEKVLDSLFDENILLKEGDGINNGFVISPSLDSAYTIKGKNYYDITGLSYVFSGITYKRKGKVLLESIAKDSLEVIIAELNFIKRYGEFNPVQSLYKEMFSLQDTVIRVIGVLYDDKKDKIFPYRDEGIKHFPSSQISIYNYQDNLTVNILSNGLSKEFKGKVIEKMNSVSNQRFYIYDYVAPEGSLTDSFLKSINELNLSDSLTRYKYLNKGIKYFTHEYMFTGNYKSSIKSISFNENRDYSIVYDIIPEGIVVNENILYQAIPLRYRKEKIDLYSREAIFSSKDNVLKFRW